MIEHRYLQFESANLASLLATCPLTADLALIHSALVLISNLTDPQVLVISPQRSYMSSYADLLVLALADRVQVLVLVLVCLLELPELIMKVVYPYHRST